MRAFRKLSIAEHIIVELREWSRIDEDSRLSTAVAPAASGTSCGALSTDVGAYDDVGANRFLDLFEAVPRPEKAANVREKTIARILKNHITGRRMRFSTTPRVGPNTTPSGPKATAMPAPYALSSIGSLTSPAPCSIVALCSISKQATV